MIQIAQGLLIVSLSVFFDNIFDDATVDKDSSAPPTPLLFNWKHPGCYWMVLE